MKPVFVALVRLAFSFLMLRTLILKYNDNQSIWFYLIFALSGLGFGESAAVLTAFAVKRT